MGPNDATMNLKTVPVWTGATGVGQDEWRMWRHAFVGHAGIKGLYQIMQQSYAPPQASASELSASTELAEYTKKNQELWFLLAQATKGAAAIVVMRFEEPMPNGRGAWLELEKVYGGRAADERSAQLLKLEAKARRLTCESAGGLQQLLIQMEQLWADLAVLGEQKSESAKRATLLEAIRESYPSLFAQFAIQPDMEYDKIRRAVISAASFEQVDTEAKQQSLAFNVKARSNTNGSGSKGSQKLQPDQCAFCLKKGHKWKQCYSYLRGGRPAQRPSSMPKPDFPPPPVTGSGENQSSSTSQSRSGGNEGRSFLAMTAQVKPMADGGQSSNSITENCTWIIDSEAHKHMTPDRDLLTNYRPSTHSCTLAMANVSKLKVCSGAVRGDNAQVQRSGDKV